MTVLWCFAVGHFTASMLGAWVLGRHQRSVTELERKVARISEWAAVVNETANDCEDRLDALEKYSLRSLTPSGKENKDG